MCFSGLESVPELVEEGGFKLGDVGVVDDGAVQSVVGDDGDRGAEDEFVEMVFGGRCGGDFNLVEVGGIGLYVFVYIWVAGDDFAGFDVVLVGSGEVGLFHILVDLFVSGSLVARADDEDFLGF